MALIQIKCKNCGANLQIEENRRTAKCEYCGSVFEIEDETAQDVDNFLFLARNAEKLSNWSEAERYAQKALEVNHRAAEAWCMKLRALCGVSDIRNVITEILLDGENALTFALPQEHDSIATQVYEAYAKYAIRVLDDLSMQYGKHYTEYIARCPSAMATALQLRESIPDDFVQSHETLHKTMHDLLVTFHKTANNYCDSSIQHCNNYHNSIQLRSDFIADCKPWYYATLAKFNAGLPPALQVPAEPNRLTDEEAAIAEAKAKRRVRAIEEKQQQANIATKNESAEPVADVDSLYRNWKGKARPTYGMPQKKKEEESIDDGVGCLLWIFFFPFMLTYSIWKSAEGSNLSKAVYVIFVWIVILFVLTMGI